MWLGLLEYLTDHLLFARWCWTCIHVLQSAGIFKYQCRSHSDKYYFDIIKYNTCFTQTNTYVGQSELWEHFLAIKLFNNIVLTSPSTTILATTWKLIHAKSTQRFDVIYFWADINTKVEDRRLQNAMKFQKWNKKCFAFQEYRILLPPKY